MIEDEQILLQNLSSDLLPLPPTITPFPLPKIQAEPFILEQCLGHAESVMAVRKSPRKFYVDWSKADNHHYFTKNAEEEQDDSLSGTPSLQDYSQLSMKLEIALALIKKHNAARSGEGRGIEKRSQSNEPRREGEMRAMTKTTGTFKGSAVKQRKQSMQLRFKTEMEEEQRPSPFPAPTRMNRMEKYQAGQAIAEEVGGKQSCKENTLRTKFLQSIAQWQEKKQRRIQQRIEREIRLTMEGVTFTPEINPRSREIMKKKGIIAPIYEREPREKKRELTERFNVEQKTHRMKL